jgi:beta-ureidopropionase
LVKCSLIQLSFEPDVVTAYERRVVQAAEAGSKVIAFPELFGHPFFPACRDPSEVGPIGAPVSESPVVQRMVELAERFAIVLLVPFAERDSSGKLFDSIAVIDAGGSLSGVYRARQVPQFEGFWLQNYFEAGDSAAVFDTRQGRIGVCVCYERHFPEIWRALANDGAELGIACCGASGGGITETLWEPELMTAAYSNGMFVGAVNRVGADLGKAHFYGGSLFVGPDGRIIEAGEKRKDAVVTADIDLTKVAAMRKLRPFLEQSKQLRGR